MQLLVCWYKLNSWNTFLFFLWNIPVHLRYACSEMLALLHRIFPFLSYYPAMSFFFSPNRDEASGQGWQNGVIILVLASTHALPLIHFTARLLASEGDIAHVGEEDRAIGREDASFVILPIPTFPLFSSFQLLMLHSFMMYKNAWYHYSVWCWHWIITTEKKERKVLGIHSTQIKWVRDESKCFMHLL